MKPSGIGGQAVIEGIMMRNKNKYSIAVRKPDNEIEVVVKESRDLTEKHQWLNFPIIRGIVSFVDSLVTGISTINYSASFYDDPAEQEKTKIDEVGKNILKDKFESVLMAVTVILSILFFLKEKRLKKNCISMAKGNVIKYKYLGSNNARSISPVVEYTVDGKKYNAYRHYKKIISKNKYVLNNDESDNFYILFTYIHDERY